MDKKNIWWIVGVVIVVIIVAVVLMRGGSTMSPSPSDTSGGTQAGTAQAPSAMSLNDIFTAGASEQCAFSSQSATSSIVAATVYVGDGHMRGDFSAKSASGIITSHMVTDGKTTYVWTDNPAMGFEMAFSTTTPAASAQSHGSVDPSAKMDYSCTNWPVDQSKFTVPTNITFTNMSAVTGAGTSAGANAGASASMCSMCAQAGSASAVASCKAAMHC